SGGALIEQVWAGHPLAKVWDANGSAGGDGNVGPRPSGTLLDLNDFTIPTSARRGDGLPMMLCFDADQRQQTLDLTFASASEYCDAASRTIREGALFDDFNDGNYAGWTVVSGTWSVIGGELYQSSASGTRTILNNGTFTDISFEAKLKNTSGQTPSIVFRYLGANNFYAFGLLTTNNAVRLIRTRNGSSVVTAQAARTLSNNTWYLLRVDVSGTTIRAYLDCELVLEVTDALIRPSGKIGFRDYASRTYFDDVRVAALTGGLP
ncbi:MAG: DUF1080 domain-containing protein, partial [Candidatus Eisenbacteria bacterium]|nr:DUF1080 domain-containing protein [Candidatus Eisenbacteria bacterium]